LYDLYFKKNKSGKNYEGPQSVILIFP